MTSSARDGRQARRHVSPIGGGCGWFIRDLFGVAGVGGVVGTVAVVVVVVVVGSLPRTRTCKKTLYIIPDISKKQYN